MPLIVPGAPAGLEHVRGFGGAAYVAGVAVRWRLDETLDWEVVRDAEGVDVCVQVYARPAVPLAVPAEAAVPDDAPPPLPPFGPVTVAGAGDPRVNGEYTPAGYKDGWPSWLNASGAYLYRRPDGRWYITEEIDGLAEMYRSVNDSDENPFGEWEVVEFSTPPAPTVSPME